MWQQERKYGRKRLTRSGFTLAPDLNWWKKCPREPCAQWQVFPILFQDRDLAWQRIPICQYWSRYWTIRLFCRKAAMCIRCWRSWENWKRKILSFILYGTSSWEKSTPCSWEMCRSRSWKGWSGSGSMWLWILEREILYIKKPLRHLWKVWDILSLCAIMRKFTFFWNQGSKEAECSFLPPAVRMCWIGTGRDWSSLIWKKRNTEECWLVHRSQICRLPCLPDGPTRNTQKAEISVRLLIGLSVRGLRKHRMFCWSLTMNFGWKCRWRLLAVQWMISRKCRELFFLWRQRKIPLFWRGKRLFRLCAITRKK